MGSLNKRDEAFKALTIIGAKAPLVAILEEMVAEGQNLVLEASPSDPKINEKLIRAQERRFILEIFKREVK